MPEEKPNNYAGPKKETEGPPKLEAVATPITIKKSIGRRIAEAFTGDDAKTLGEHLLFDVFIPAAKTMIIELTTQGIERAMYGDTRPRSGRRVGYTNYNAVSSRPSSRFRDEPTSRPAITARGKAVHNFDEIILGTREEAQQVLDGLIDYLEQFDFATVSTLYDLVGITGSFQDDLWGWSNLARASVRPVRGGYILDLPRTEPAS